MIPDDPIAAAYIAACLDELDAPKPGNVHRLAPGHGMTVADFVLSAETSAASIAERGARVGLRIRNAVDATMAASRQNTNLGIILLCAPLAAAAESIETALRPALAAVLDGLDRDDAADVFAAIVTANPGGLGRSERHDVRAPATATLKEAMAEAAERDRIARQYVTVYEDIFSLGLPALDAAQAKGRGRRFATLAVYFAFLASLPDSHILRKFGAATAVETQREAARWREALETADDPESMVAELLRWDAALKSRAINPGTSADLTVATLFAAALASIGAAHLDLTR